nr:Hop-interacting protein THI110 [Ipomoea batatas]
MQLMLKLKFVSLRLIISTAHFISAAQLIPLTPHLKSSRLYVSHLDCQRHHRPIARVFFGPASPPWLVTDDIRKIFPLVLSLMDQNPNASFTRKASVNYTKTPSRESLYNEAWAKEDLLREQNKELQTYSKLMCILKDGLSGNSHTIMIITMLTL